MFGKLGNHAIYRGIMGAKDTQSIRQVLRLTPFIKEQIGNEFNQIEQ